MVWFHLGQGGVAVVFGFDLGKIVVVMVFGFDFWEKLVVVGVWVRFGGRGVVVLSVFFGVFRRLWFLKESGGFRPF